MGRTKGRKKGEKVVGAWRGEEKKERGTEGEKEGKESRGRERGINTSK